MAALLLEAKPCICTGVCEATDRSKAVQDIQSIRYQAAKIWPWLPCKGKVQPGEKAPVKQYGTAPFPTCKVVVFKSTLMNYFNFYVERCVSACLLKKVFYFTSSCAGTQSSHQGSKSFQRISVSQGAETASASSHNYSKSMASI